MMGKRGMIEGTRELLPHKNYRLVYELIDDEIWIHAIVHAARQWPPQ
jgi:plasmid stabilization system protein ParE